jgi:hypothetical protein
LARTRRGPLENERHRRRSWWRLRGTLVVSALVSALVVPAVASGHIIHSNGTWTYRYLTRSNTTDCGGGTGGGDPFNVLFWQYGEGNRMNSHAEADSDWGHYSGTVPRSHDYICGDSDGCVGCYTVNDHLDFDDQEGHGSWYTGTRSHFRLWYAPHGHDSIVDKWSTIDVHHEKIVFSTNVHQIDQDWETWEYHFSSEMASHHNWWYDYWARQGYQYLKGFYDDGAITRVGGLHDGVY